MPCAQVRSVIFIYLHKSIYLYLYICFLLYTLQLSYKIKVEIRLLRLKNRLHSHLLPYIPPVWSYLFATHFFICIFTLSRRIGIVTAVFLAF